MNYSGYLFNREQRRGISDFSPLRYHGHLSTKESITPSSRFKKKNHSLSKQQRDF